MDQLKQFLLWPENWLASRDVSSQVLKNLTSDKAEIYDVFIAPRLDMVADGEITAVDTSDEAGGFGAPEVVVAVVVPAVVSALASILTQVGVITITDFRQKRISEKQIIFSVTDEVKAIIKITNPSLKPHEVNRLVGDVQDALRKFLVADEYPTHEGVTPTELGRLREMIDAYFNESELRTLCFDISIDEEILIGETKQDKVRQLLLYCTRRGRINDLVNACRQARPHLDW